MTHVMPRRFDLLLLDLDGTLVDSQSILVGLVNDTLDTAGYARAAVQIVAGSIGLPLDEVFRRAAPDASDDAVARLCTSYRRRADTPEFVRQFRLYGDVASTLTALRSAGARLVVATSKGRATTLDILRHCAIDNVIDAVIGGDSVSRGKPHPEMVHQAQALFAIPPERTVLIGDTSFDMQMGQAAGVATCAVTYGMHAADVLRALQPDFVIDRFAMLRELLIGPTPRD
jgi:phosphoglycolate phosphatase